MINKKDDKNETLMTLRVLFTYTEIFEQQESCVFLLLNIAVVSVLVVSADVDVAISAVVHETGKFGSLLLSVRS